MNPDVWPVGSLDGRVRDAARAYGFDLVGVARADVPLDVDFDRYRAFLDAEMHGEMRYLADDAEARRRLDTGAILPGAKSVVCVAKRYGPRADEDDDPPTARAIARYARGRDYHNGVRKKLRRLAAFLRRLGAPHGPVAEPIDARPLIDDAPVLERAWAARAGLGFIGKNGLLIAPGQGSMLLLGEVVTTLALTPDTPMGEKCGSCTRCLDACPTRAFPRPFVLDARRCISYWTIEQRSAIAEEDRPLVGERVFGCDACQTVCPFNRGSTEKPGMRAPSEAFAPHPRWAETRIEDLLDASTEAWTRISEGSPVHRATADGLARNAAIALGNKGDRASLAALDAAARAHPSAVVRDAAAWAAARIRSVIGEAPR